MTTQKLAEMFHDAWYGQYINQGEEHWWGRVIAVISVIWWGIKHSVISTIDAFQRYLEERNFNPVGGDIIEYLRKLLEE